MSYAIGTAMTEVRAVLEPVLEGVWVGLGYDANTIEWPNTYFNKPGTGQKPEGPWIRITYPQASTFALTWGGPGNVVQNTTLAILALQIFVPRNAGDALLLAASDAFRGALERRSFGEGIRFREALGPNDTAFESQWAGRAFSFPFEFIEDIAI